MRQAPWFIGPAIDVFARDSTATHCPYQWIGAHAAAMRSGYAGDNQQLCVPACYCHIVMLSLHHQHSCPLAFVDTKLAPQPYFRLKHSRQEFMASTIIMIVPWDLQVAYLVYCDKYHHQPILERKKTSSDGGSGRGAESCEQKRFYCPEVGADFSRA